MTTREREDLLDRASRVAEDLSSHHARASVKLDGDVAVVQAWDHPDDRGHGLVPIGDPLRLEVERV